MEKERRGRSKEVLDWLHHAYWIREALGLTGIAAGVMRWITTTSSAFSRYAWPAGIVLAGVLVFALDWFRQYRALRRSKAESNPQGASALVVNLSDQGNLPGVDIKEFFRLAYRTNSEEEVRNNIRILLGLFAPRGFSSPRSYCGFQRNTWLAFTPLARAIPATLAPGSSVNFTILSFSSTRRNTRRFRPGTTVPSMRSSWAVAHWLSRWDHQTLT